MKIILNGQAVEVNQVEISFDEIIRLSFDNPPTGLTVQYTRGGGDKPAGTLLEGQSVNVKDGMVFDAVQTGRA